MAVMTERLLGRISAASLPRKSKNGSIAGFAVATLNMRRRALLAAGPHNSIVARSCQPRPLSTHLALRTLHASLPGLHRLHALHGRSFLGVGLLHRLQTHCNQDSKQLEGIFQLLREALWWTMGSAFETSRTNMQDSNREQNLLLLVWDSTHLPHCYPATCKSYQVSSCDPDLLSAKDPWILKESMVCSETPKHTFSISRKLIMPMRQKSHVPEHAWRHSVSVLCLSNSDRSQVTQF